jgi:type IV pilus assembly protein PilW
MRRHKSFKNLFKLAGFTLLELLIAMAMGIAVMSGVVSVLVVSKSNYITERELAALGENARFALKFLTEEIQMAGFNGCNEDALNAANSVNFSADDAWYLGGVGLVGYEEFANETDRAGFPDDYENEASYYSDSIVIRRGEQSGLRIAPGPPYHNPNSANIPLNDAHDIKPGTIMVISSSDCQQVGALLKFHFAESFRPSIVKSEKLQRGLTLINQLEHKNHHFERA